jgi:O-antigen/teichoic acid export membrane protein
MIFVKIKNNPIVLYLMKLVLSAKPSGDKDFFGIFKHAKNYLLADIAAKAMGLIALPIYTRMLLPEDYGIISIFNAYVALFTILLPVNLFSGISRFFFDKNIDFGIFVGTCFIMAMPLVLVIGYIAFVLPDWIVGVPSFLLPYIILVAITGIGFSVYSQILVSEQRSQKYSLLNMIRGYSIFFLSLFFLYWFDSVDKYWAIIGANICISCLIGMYVFGKLKKTIIFKFNPSYAIQILKFSLPQIPYIIGSMWIGQIDRVLVSTLGGIHGAGLYSVACSIGMILNMIVSAGFTALMPKFFMLYDSGEYSRVFMIEKKQFALIVAFAIGLVLFSSEIIQLLTNSKYHAAAEMVAPIVIGYTFVALFNIYTKYIGYMKQTIWASVILIISGAVNYLANIILIPIWGYVAGAYALLISCACMFIVSYFIAKKIVPMPINKLSDFVISLSILGIATVVLLTIKNIHLSYWVEVVVKGIIWLISAVYLAKGVKKKAESTPQSV